VKVDLPDFLKKLKINNPLKLLRLFYEFFQLLLYSLKYDPEYIWGIYTLPYGLYSVIVSLIIKSKSIVSVIGGNVEIETYFRMGKMFKEVNLWLLKNADAVTTMGNKGFAYLLGHGIQKEKLEIYTGGIDISKFRYIDQKRKTDVLFVGALRELKGPDRVLKVILSLKEEFPNISCKIVGDGYLKDSLMQFVSQHKLNNNIEILGYVNSTIGYFQNSKIIIIPSESEGLPMVMLEAMSCGVVPIVSNVGNVSDVAIHGNNSMVVNNFLDINLYKFYARELLSNPDKLHEMRCNAIKTVKENYSVSIQAEVFHRIIKTNSKMAQKD
jgi:glycosyltransferase involved in cell wall biosynthesis